MRPITTHMTTAYEIGRSYHGKTVLDAWTTEIYGNNRIDPEDQILSACFEAGVCSHEMLTWVTGWRYGEIPAGGYSRNHRNDISERGVSIMALDTDTEPQTDGTFELFNATRPRVQIGGWLIGFRGSDGERLVVGAVAL